MTRRILLGAFALIVALGALIGRSDAQGDAQGAAQRAAGTPVTFKGASRQLTGVVFTPDGPGPFPAVIDIHGINGQSEWDFEIGRRLAAQGYVVLAVDLFGRRPRSYADGLHLRDQIRPQGGEDLAGALSYLQSRKDVVPDRIGTVGWCMGGTYALLFAVADPRLAASVVYYGPVTPPPGPDPAALKNIRAPILAHFGLDDDSINLPSVKVWANDMRKADKSLDLHWYPAGHGFAEVHEMPATHGEHHQENYAAVSWERTLAFLDARLKRGKS
jgi:carboxymethylenebutenolidase